jgi:hypothetical protein
MTRTVAPLLAILLGAGPTLAEDPEAQAEALIRRGVELRHAGKDEHALPFFQKAYQIAPAARTAAQLGLVEMQLRHWLEAERHLLDSLASPRDPWVSRNRADLERSLAAVKAAIGQITLSGAPPGTDIYLNGSHAGRVPLSEPLRAGQGPTRLELRATGYKPLLRMVTLAGGGLQEVTVSLERDSSRAVDAHLAGSKAAVEAVTPEEPRSGFLAVARPLTWATGAAALGALGFGAYQTIRWSRKSADFNEYVANPTSARMASRGDCGVDDPDRGAAGCSAIYQQVAEAKKLAVSGYVVGGFLAAGAAALFLLSRVDEIDSREVAACTPALAWPGGWCRIVF